MELMKVPRVESKLKVFLFKIQFHSQVWQVIPSLANHELCCFALLGLCNIWSFSNYFQVSDLKQNLNIVNSSAEEVGTLY